MKIKSYPHIASLVLRIGLAVVVAWFGISQFMNPAAWTGIVPKWATGMTGLEPLIIIHINAWFEIIAGAFLAMGIFTRWVALILSVHILVIASGFGLSATGARDFGLAISLFSIFLAGSDEFCFDCKSEEI